MRYPATDKLEIIRLVENSHLGVKRTALFTVLAYLVAFLCTALAGCSPGEEAFGDDENDDTTLSEAEGKADTAQGGVAFFAHIRGFAAGALAGVLIRATAPRPG